MLNSSMHVRKGKSKLLPRDSTLAYKFQVIIEKVIEKAFILVYANHLMKKLIL
jgi:hypothetical protein